MIAPQLVLPDSLQAWSISPADTVRLAPLRGPDAVSDISVFFEVWDEGGAQPFNRHPTSVETFFFLRGSGTACVDDHVVDIVAGAFVVLPPGTRHRIVNTGVGRLYAITTMMPDEGFHELVTSGSAVELGEDDRAVLVGRRPAIGTELPASG